MNKLLRVGLAVAALTAVGGCATVTRGTRQQLEILTIPTGADVALSSGERCLSPCHISVKRGGDLTVTINLAGYQTMTVEVKSEFNAKGPLLLGGVIGGVVDSTNGSLNTLRPNPINVTLIPNDAGQ